MQHDSRRSYEPQSPRSAQHEARVQQSDTAKERGVRSRRRFLGGTAAAATAGILLAKPEAASASIPQLYNGANASIFEEIRSDENTHAAFIANALGAAARPKPTFQNLVAPTLERFVAMAFAFENTGARAYTAAAPFINNPTYLSVAARIALVEGRHASYINALEDQPLVPGGLAFEIPMMQAEVVHNVTPYIASLNGGPAPAYLESRSMANDGNILNFALLLEYLEAEFYNLNVPTFFP